VRVMSLRHARYPLVNLSSTLYERTSLGSDIASNRQNLVPGSKQFPRVFPGFWVLLEE